MTLHHRRNDIAALVFAALLVISVGIGVVIQAGELIKSVLGW